MKISLKKILLFLIMLYPILPVNFYIGPFSYSNICAILIVSIYVIGMKNKKIINIFKNIPFFWIYLMVYAIFAIFTSSFLVGIAWIFSTILVSLIIIDVIKTEEDFNSILNMIVISSVILSFIGIFEAISHRYLIQGNLLPVMENMRYGILRATGPFGICINYGLYQALSAIIIFYKMVQKDKKSRKLMISYILVVFSVFLSVSRLAICLFIAAQIIIYFQIGYKKALKNIFLGILIISIVLIILDTFGFAIFNLFSDFTISLLELFGQSTDSNTNDIVGFGDRTNLYAWVLADMNNNFLLGKGLDAQFTHKLASWLTKTSIEVHYLNILYHCGMVGLIALILGYINVVKYFWNNRSIKKGKLSFSKLLLIMLILYYVCLFGVQETDLTRFYCELIAIGIAYVKINRSYK